MPKSYLIAVAVALTSACARGGSHEFRFDFEPADVALRASASGEVLVSLENGELGEGHPGKPWIPYRDYSIRLPSGVEHISWTVDVGESVLLADGVVPVPEQMPEPTGACDGEAGPTPRDEAAYASAEPYPALRCEHLSTGSMRGIGIASFRISPIWYVAAEKKLYLAKSVVVKVESGEGRPPHASDDEAMPCTRLFDDAVDSLVLNPASPSAGMKALRSVPKSGSGVQYLVVTKVALAAPAQRLADFRAEFDGVTAGVVTIEEIESSGAYSGLRPDGGTDMQTKIRNCIKWHVQNRGTEYVVLAGDNTIVPTRGVHVRASSYEYKDAPSDLYYSDLDGDWDANRDGDYAYTASGDGTDLYPDVVVGRIPVRSESQLSNYVDKVVAYERGTTSDSDIVRKMLWLGFTLCEDLKRTSTGWVNVENGSEDAKGRTISETFADGLQEVADRNVGAWVNDMEVWCRRLNKSWHRRYRPNFRTSFCFGSATSWDGETAGDCAQTQGVDGNVHKILEQGCHQMFVGSHGTKSGYLLEGTKTLTGGFSMPYAGAAARQLTNRVDFVYTVACLTDAFDDPYTDPSLSEAFIRAPGGAVGYIGCCREGWLTKMYSGPAYLDNWTQAGSANGKSFEYAKEFFKRIFQCGDTKLGVAFANHKAARAASSAYSESERWLQLLINLQGDPLLTYHLPPADEADPRQNGRPGLVTLLRDGLPEASSSSISARIAVDEIPLGASAVVSLEFSKSPTFSSATTVAVEPSARRLGVFEHRISGLSADTDYYLRGKIEMNGATSYSPFMLKFRTKGLEAEEGTVVYDKASRTATVSFGGATYDISAAFTLSDDGAGGVDFALNPSGSVTIGAETIPVLPTLSEADDPGFRPLEVGAGSVGVGVRTIPGLTYGLRRGESAADARAGDEVARGRAKGVRMKLVDPMAGGMPSRAFYSVEVSK